MTHSYVWHDSFICVTWLIHMCDMTHSYVWHDSFICVTWLIRMCDVTEFICGTWLNRMCVGVEKQRLRRANHPWHDSFVCAVKLIRMRDLTHLYVCRPRTAVVSKRRSPVTWLHSYVCHVSFVRVTWLICMCVGFEMQRFRHIHYPCHDSIRIHDVNHSYVALRRIRICEVTEFIGVLANSYVCLFVDSNVVHDSFTYMCIGVERQHFKDAHLLSVTWVHSYMWHDPCVCLTWLNSYAVHDFIVCVLASKSSSFKVLASNSSSF